MSARVLMTVDAVGGVWTYSLELAAALRVHGVRTVLAVLGPAASAEQRAAAAAGGVKIVDLDQPLDWLAADAGAVAAAAAAVAALAQAEAVDLIHLNQPALAGVAPFAVPVVTVIHSCVATWWTAVRRGPLQDAFAWQTDLVRRGLHAADAVVAPTQAFAAAVAAEYGRRPEVVHNGRTSLVIAPAPMHDFAFTAGRLWDAGKDAATLDRAAARLAVPFKAAGPLAGPHGAAIACDHLHTVGPLGGMALAACLAARPVFASAARYEPFGLAVLEAALAGCALVLSDIATFRELWDGAATFVPVGDDAAFAAAIRDLIGETPARLASGDRARAHAARYAPAAMAAATAMIYRRVLAAPARVAA